MSLRISLRDGEKIIVNGAVLRAVGRTDLVVENQAAILRGREVMAPEEANTPARRLYSACMMAYIDQDGLETHQEHILTLLRELISALEYKTAKAACVGFAARVANGDFYRALSDCRTLIAYEDGVLARPGVEAA